MRRMWNEEMIRTELARLDTLTGLSGAGLPVSFINCKTSPARFTVGKDGYCGFGFSKQFFSSPEFACGEAVDAIRRAYARYMNYALDMQTGYTAAWARYCVKLGVTAERRFIKAKADERLAYESAQEEREAADERLLEQARSLTTGTQITHDRFGRGVIIRRDGEGLEGTLEIDFMNGGRKKLGVRWVALNCAAGEAPGLSPAC